MAADIAKYEKHIVDQYHQLDLYRTKGKKRAKISFNDLTLQENLNYIKFNLKNSNDAFELYNITQAKYNVNPEIPASIVQKLAVRSTLKASEVNEKLVARFEYKNMLRQIQNNLNLLDNKQAVDTLYSVAKLHKGSTATELAKEHPDFARYF